MWGITPCKVTFEEAQQSILLMGKTNNYEGRQCNGRLEAEKRDGGGMEAPSCFSSHSCSSINLVVSFLLLDGLAMLHSERKLRIFVTRGSSSSSSCAQPVVDKIKN